MIVIALTYNNSNRIEFLTIPCTKNKR